jgi:hypothetical protein
MLKTFCDVMPHTSVVSMKPSTYRYSREVAHCTETVTATDQTTRHHISKNCNPGYKLNLCKFFVILKKKLKAAILFS